MKAGTRDGLMMISGIIVWALHLGAIYGVTGLVCARTAVPGWPDPAMLPWFIGGATIVALAAVLGFVVPALRPGARRGARHWITAGIGGFAFVGILYQGLPALLVAPCTA